MNRPVNKAPAAATAAKSLQLCPTLCDPIDGSPLGSPVPGILQARILEWVAIPEADKGKKMCSLLESAEGAADADVTPGNTYRLWPPDHKSTFMLFKSQNVW